MKEVNVKVKCLYLYWITLSAIWAVLPRGPVRANPHGSSVTTGGNRSTRRKPAMLGRVKLDNTLLTCDQANFYQINARNRNWTLVTVMRDTCTTTVPPAPRVKWSEDPKHLFWSWIHTLHFITWLALCLVELPSLIHYFVMISEKIRKRIRNWTCLNVFNTSGIITKNGSYFGRRESVNAIVQRFKYVLKRIVDVQHACLKVHMRAHACARARIHTHAYVHVYSNT